MMWTPPCPQLLYHNFRISVVGVFDLWNNLLVKMSGWWRLFSFIDQIWDLLSPLILWFILQNTCPRLRSVASCYCLLINGGSFLFGTEWITVYFGPRQSLQWTLFLKTIRWSWYSNRFGFGQFSLLRQNIENVNIGDQSNAPTSVDSKDLNTLGQDDIIDNIMTLK